MNFGNSCMRAISCMIIDIRRTLKVVLHSLSRMLRLLALLVIALTSSAVAQPSGLWLSNRLCDDCEREVLISEINGPLTVIGDLRDYHVVWTSESGEQWDSVFASSTQLGILITGYNIYSVPEPGHLYAISSHVRLYSTDSGHSWSRYPGFSGNFASGMTSAQDGYALLRHYTDGAFEVEGRGITDSGKFATERLFDFAAPDSALRPSDGFFWTRDSGIILYSYPRCAIALTGDGGVNWEFNYLLESDAKGVQFSPMLSFTPDAARFYIVGGKLDSSDFFYTTNHGTSWTESRGLAPGRIYRLVETSPNELWALVGQSIQGELFDLLMLAESPLDPPAVADSLFFSGDGGESWEFISRFVGDTVTDMRRGPNGGLHILTNENNGITVHTFLPSSSVVERTRPVQFQNLGVFPTPFQTSFKFTLPMSVSASVKLLDILGNVRYHNQHQIQAGVPEKVDVPESLVGFTGPLLLLLEANGNVAAQMIIKL